MRLTRQGLLPEGPRKGKSLQNGATDKKKREKTTGKSDSISTPSHKRRRAVGIEVHQNQGEEVRFEPSARTASQRRGE